MRMMLMLLLATLWVACTGGNGVDLGLETAVPSEISMEKPTFRVIAYVTGGVIPDLIPYDKLTHIHYAFLVPNADGTFAPMANTWKLEQIVADAHKAGVQVLISVGGWGWDDEFEAMAADVSLRDVFVHHLSAFVTDHNLDGADIDWEYPDPGQSAQNFLALIQALRNAMPDKLLATAVVSYGRTGHSIPEETFALFNYVNVMTYDGPDHGTMAQFNTGMEYWRGRGLPSEKMVMGVPFYARPRETVYRKIVSANPEGAYTDTVEWNGETIYYNGIPTIQAKTRLAMEHAGGIMFWTLEHDAEGEFSLLKAIDETVQQR